MKKKRILRILCSKYFITGIAFVVWLTFFDKHSVIEHIAIKRNISRMEREVRRLHILSEQNSRRLQELQISNAALERFARERYLMHTPSEDLFMIE